MSSTACDDQLIVSPDDVVSNPVYDVKTDKVFEVGQRVKGVYDANDITIGTIATIYKDAQFPVVIKSEKDSGFYFFKFSEVTAI